MMLQAFTIELFGRRGLRSGAGLVGGNDGRDHRMESCQVVSAPEQFGRTWIERSHLLSSMIVITSTMSACVSLNAVNEGNIGLAVVAGARQPVAVRRRQTNQVHVLQSWAGRHVDPLAVRRAASLVD